MQPKLQAYLSRVRPPPFDTAICAHRGASATAPENTLSAFRHAIDAGTDLIEFDVLCTRDNRLAVIHDEKLGRTTDGAGRVTQLTLEELRGYDAGTWFTETFRGERVPTLVEALEVIRRRAVPMIELKQTLAKCPALVDQVASDLRAAGSADRAILIAWNADTADALRRLLPDALIARVAFTRLGVKSAAASRLDGVVSYQRSTTKRLIVDAHALGLFVAPWTVNHPVDMDFFIESGVDIVITDLPHVLTDRLERRELERARDLLASEPG